MIVNITKACSRRTNKVGFSQCVTKEGRHTYFSIIIQSFGFSSGRRSCAVVTAHAEAILRGATAAVQQAAPQIDPGDRYHATGVRVGDCVPMKDRDQRGPSRHWFRG